MKKDLALAEMLKNETDVLHRQAETEEFQTLLMRGQLERRQLAAFFEQLYCLHDFLETCWRKAEKHFPALSGLLAPEQFHTNRIAHDVEFWGGSLDAEPGPSVDHLIRCIDCAATQDPGFLAGVVYVLEGSRNGGRYQALAIRRNHDLKETEGTEYFDPYGDDQRKTWKAFRDRLNALPLSEADQLEALAGAQRTFQAVTGAGAEALQRDSDALAQ
ncbi:biliverdin-producing heme oxygenase [bacterium]|nr:biliverdin-producing heme oxygenase [bacterium]